MMKIDDRFTLIKQLGQGSFSTIYSADDRLRNMKVALKIEKPDKSKRILMFEYDVLKQLQGLKHTPQVFEFVDRKNNGQNFIVMRLLGKNLANQKKILGRKMTMDQSINYLVQMLDAIEEVHNRGFIHRDIKPSNFVVGKALDKPKVYIVDFGLAKQHLSHGVPVPMRSQADFRGTITYASLNAHHKIDLSRRDDLWSFYFVILDFLNEILPWRNNSVKDEVKDIKIKCFANPEKYLWTATTRGLQQVKDVFYHLKNLEYADTPNYQFIREKLIEIKHTHTTRFLQQQLPQVVFQVQPINPINQQTYAIQRQNPIYEIPYNQTYQYNPPFPSQNKYIIQQKPNSHVHNNLNENPQIGMKSQFQNYDAKRNCQGFNYLIDPMNSTTTIYQPVYQPQSMVYQPQSTFDIRRPKYQQVLFQPVSYQQQQLNVSNNQYQTQVYQQLSGQPHMRQTQTYQFVKPQTTQISYEPVEYVNYENQYPININQPQQQSLILTKTMQEQPSLKYDLIERCCSPFLVDRKVSNESFNEKLFEQQLNLSEQNYIKQQPQPPQTISPQIIQQQQPVYSSSSSNNKNQFNPFQQPPFQATTATINNGQVDSSNYQCNYVQECPQYQLVDCQTNQPYIGDNQEFVIQPQPLYIQVQEAPQYIIQPIQTQTQSPPKYGSNTLIIQQQPINPTPIITHMKKRDQKFMEKIFDPRKQQYEQVKRELLNQQYNQKKLLRQKEPIVHVTQNVINISQLNQNIGENQIGKITSSQTLPQIDVDQIIKRQKQETQNIIQQHANEHSYHKDIFKVETDKDMYQHKYGNNTTHTIDNQNANLNISQK